MASLPIEPTKSSSRNVETRFLQADLGDGYTQRAGDGIQTVIESWNVTFEALDQTTADTLIAFFEDLDGYQKFEWTPFRQSVEKKFICPTWSEGYPGNSLTSVQATFQQVFDQA